MKRLNLMLILATFLITSCSVSGNRRIVEMDGYKINYGPTRVKSSAPAGRTPLLFTFTPGETHRLNGVTDAQFQKEAENSGLTVQTVKILYGEAPYIGKEGWTHASVHLQGPGSRQV